MSADKLLSKLETFAPDEKISWYADATFDRKGKLQTITINVQKGNHALPSIEAALKDLIVELETSE